jgi:hypothetical protein
LDQQDLFPAALICALLTVITGSKSAWVSRSENGLLVLEP